MDRIITMNTHLKGDLGFRGFLWYSILVHCWDMTWCTERVGIYFDLNELPKFRVSIAINDLVDLCPNLWCNNLKETLLFGICFCNFDFPFICTKNACFCCVLCINFTTFCSLTLKNTTKKPSRKKAGMYRIN